MTLQWVLQWFNILFLLPLAMALIYLGVYAVSGWTFGDAEIDHDFDHDVDVDANVEADINHDIEAEHDVDVEADSDVESEGSGAPTAVGTTSSEGILSWLGVGRVPLSLILMLLLMSFGVIGFIANQVAHDFVRDGAIIFISLPIAIAGSAAMTRVTTRLLNRFMPMNETYAEHKKELLGLNGEALFAIDDQFGLAAVRDRRGNRHQVPCRVDRGRPAIEKGTAVTLVGYSAQQQVFTVIPDIVGPN